MTVTVGQKRLITRKQHGSAVYLEGEVSTGNVQRFELTGEALREVFADDVGVIIGTASGQRLTSLRIERWEGDIAPHRDGENRKSRDGQQQEERGWPSVIECSRVSG